MLKERLLGFDAREMWMDTEEFWPLERKQSYLFREDVLKPFSTDETTWPSIFDHGEGSFMAAAERERWGFTGLQTPSWTGANGLWQDLAEMRRHTATNQPYYSIAVTWLDDTEDGEVLHLGPHALPTQPPNRNSDWQLLGYDISDGSLLSGLSNCGWGKREEQIEFIKPVKLYWKDQLNDNHLFNDIDRALEFRKFTDERVSEHAPFFVFGLWLIETVNFS